MRVNALDHINVMTRDIAGTARFYHEVFGLAQRDPPPGLDPGMVQWMYDDSGRPIVHIAQPGALFGEESRGEIPRDTGTVHHLALDCSGFDAMRARLQALGLEHRANHVAAIDLKQLFVRDPNGLLIELNFRAGNH